MKETLTQWWDKEIYYKTYFPDVDEETIQMWKKVTIISFDPVTGIWCILYIPVRYES